MKDKDILQDLLAVIQDRRDNPIEGSYTCYLLGQGLDKILKKLGEECAETLIAAKNGDHEATVSELCDLLYHLLVMMAAQGIEWEAIRRELTIRRDKIGNLKTMRETDRHT